MSESQTILRVFIASPNDLQAERRAIKDVAESLNATFGREVNIQVQLLGWEDRLPGFGRPQSQINGDVDKADLFVGFIWRRWGTPPGDQQFTSGFEEEFRRAVNRRERTGFPEICLFFKEVETATLQDPGDQLKKVLDFKEEMKRSQKILYREFRDDINDWKQQTRDLLECHLLRLLKALRVEPDQPKEPNLPSSKLVLSGTKEPKASLGSSDEDISELFTAVKDAVRNGELSIVDKSTTLERSDVARLGLVALSLVNRDVEADLASPHLLNLLYKQRAKIELTVAEKILVLKTNIANTAQNAPGLFWLPRNLKVSQVLIRFALLDGNVLVRRAAIQLLNDLDAPLLKKLPGADSLIARACNDEDSYCRKLAVAFLARKGTVRDLPLIQSSLRDSDSDVRKEAEAARVTVLVRHDVAAGFESAILGSKWVDDSQISAVRPYAHKVGSLLLRKGLSHPHENVRLFCARALAERGEISESELKALSNDEPTEAWAAYYRHLIKVGQRLIPEEVRSTMRPQILSWRFPLRAERTDPSSVVSEYFTNRTYDELLQYLNVHSPDGALAYRALTHSHFRAFEPHLRRDLGDDFASLEANSKTSEFVPKFRGLVGLLSTDEATSSWKNEFLEAGLSGLALNGTPSDRDLFLTHVKSSSTGVKLAAIRGLARFGTIVDAQALLSIALSDASEEINCQAAKAAVALSPGPHGAASEFIKAVKPPLFKIGILSLFGHESKVVWPLVEDRLNDPHEEIRRIVASYAISRFPHSRVERLLNEYLDRERYYYDVVFLWDRALYAPVALRRLFKEEAEQHFGR